MTDGSGTDHMKYNIVYLADRLGNLSLDMSRFFIFPAAIIQIFIY